MYFAEFGLACEYFRERKKRGKASRKDLAAQHVTHSGSSTHPTSPGDNSSEGPSPTRPSQRQNHVKGEQPSSLVMSALPSSNPRSLDLSGASTSGSIYNEAHSRVSGEARGNMQSTLQRRSSIQQQVPDVQGIIQQDQLPPRKHLRGSPTPISLNGFGLMQDYSRPGMHNIPTMSGSSLVQGAQGINQLPAQPGTQNGYSAYGEGAYPTISPQDHHPSQIGFTFGRTGESPLTGFMTGSPAASSPGWLSLPSPSGGMYAAQTLLSPPNTLRYPVLQPLIPHLGSIMPTSLACDLLELYFTSSSSAFMHPLSPYVLGYVFRKRSFLHPTRPRACSPALLCSMLWVVAQHSDAPFLSSPPSARGRICQKLLELTVGFLRPLIHGPSSSDTSPNYGMNTVINGVALGGLGVTTMVSDHTSANGGATGGTDDVAAYIHLATVVSASEYKAASLRWWNAAWSLARELKLGRELPPNPHQPRDRDQTHISDIDADGDADPDVQHSQGQNGTVNGHSPPIQPPGHVNEEEKEERRRIWWLLYIMDRHLALCYNRPLFLLDAECDGLLQPVNDNIWQAGDSYTGDPSSHASSTGLQTYRQRGPNFECTSHSIFGYFLPLMTILGEIVDLNHSRNHPRFGITIRSSADWDDQASEITQQLEAYGRSLRDFDASYTASLQAQTDVPNNNEAKQHTPSQQQVAPSTSNRQSAETVSTPSARSANSYNSSQHRLTTESIIQTRIVLAYGTHVMHVLHILLTGKWDPISLLDDNDLWISSTSFINATGHAVNAAEAISDILEYDPDLSFMPFFFGIYLLQGSFLLLLIADKLCGEASPSVVKACETIVRAHEACVVTLNTEYQVGFDSCAINHLFQRITEDIVSFFVTRADIHINSAISAK